MYTHTHKHTHMQRICFHNHICTFKHSKDPVEFIQNHVQRMYIYLYIHMYIGVSVITQFDFYVLQTHSEVSVFALKKKLSNVYCVRLGHISKAWKLVEVLLIPKDGKRSYFGAKDLRPISLFSFPLKTMERFMELYIRSRIPRAKLLRAQQTYIRVMAGGSPYAQGFCCIYLSRHLGSFQQWVARGGV